MGGGVCRLFCLLFAAFENQKLARTKPFLTPILLSPFFCSLVTAELPEGPICVPHSYFLTLHSVQPTSFGFLPHQPAVEGTADLHVTVYGSLWWRNRCYAACLPAALDVIGHVLLSWDKFLADVSPHFLYVPTPHWVSPSSYLWLLGSFQCLTLDFLWEMSAGSVSLLVSCLPSSI